MSPMAPILVFRCDACGAPLAPVERGTVVCAYCRAPNVVAVLAPTEKATLDGDVTLVAFPSAPLLHEAPAWVVTPPSDATPDVIVLPTVGIHRTVPAGILAGLASALVEHLVLGAGLMASATFFVDNRTRTIVHPEAPSADADVWRRAVGADARHALLAGVVADGDDLTLHVLPPGGRLRRVALARGAVEEMLGGALEDALVRELANEGIARKGRPASWYRRPSPEVRLRMLRACTMDLQLLVASGMEGSTALATKTFASMTSTFGAGDVARLFDATMALVEVSIGDLPQLALTVSRALTLADERDVLGDDRKRQVARLLADAPPGTLLHAMSPWMASFVGETDRAIARLCALRPRAFGSYADWLDGIEDDDLPDARTFAVLATLPVASGPRDARTGIGLGPVEFGARLEEVAREFGTHGPADEDGRVDFANGVCGLFDDSGVLFALEVDVTGNAFTFHGLPLDGLDESSLRAFWKARSVDVTREEGEDGAWDLLVPLLGWRFRFEDGSLATLQWSSLETDGTES